MSKITKSVILGYELNFDDPHRYTEDEPNVVLGVCLLRGDSDLNEKGKEFLELLNDEQVGIDGFLNNHPQRRRESRYNKEQVYQWYGSVFEGVEGRCPEGLAFDRHKEKKADVLPPRRMS